MRISGFECADEKCNVHMVYFEMVQRIIVVNLSANGTSATERIGAHRLSSFSLRPLFAIAS